MGKMRYICRVNAYVMNCRYFRVMPNAYEEEGGIVISPDVNACPHVYDGEDVERGKVFVYDVEEVVRVRTGETGYDALQESEE